MANLNHVETTLSLSMKLENVLHDALVLVRLWPIDGRRTKGGTLLFLKSPLRVLYNETNSVYILSMTEGINMTFSQTHSFVLAKFPL